VARANRHYEAGLVWHNTHQSQWSESIAVGSPAFLEEVKARLGAKASGRRVEKGEDGHRLKEPVNPYKGLFGVEKGLLRPQNGHFRQLSDDLSTR